MCVLMPHEVTRAGRKQSRKKYCTDVFRRCGAFFSQYKSLETMRPTDMVGETNSGEMMQNNSQRLYIHSLSVLLLTEDMILALAGQFKQLSHEPEKFR